MKKITKLQGEAADAPVWEENRGLVGCVLFEPQPGCFIHITIGAAGVMIFHDDAQVGIPIDELVRLAQKHEPRLVPELIPPQQSKDGKGRLVAAPAASISARIPNVKPPPLPPPAQVRKNL